jgi:uncharacterized protein (TIGR01244 family)
VGRTPFFGLVDGAALPIESRDIVRPNRRWKRTMSDFRTLSSRVMASPQIAVADLSAARDCGVSTIVNNRPEGEADDQTPGDAIEVAARSLGLDYVAIPITPGAFNEAQVRALIDVLEHADGKVLAYCRTGTRSTLLWALAQAAIGTPVEEVATAAESAGYDISPVRAAMAALANRAGS